MKKFSDANTNKAETVVNRWPDWKKNYQLTKYKSTSSGDNQRAEKKTNLPKKDTTS